jgi:hypothetical protein
MSKDITFIEKEAYDLLEKNFPHWSYCKRVDYMKASCPNDKTGCKSCNHDKESMEERANLLTLI